MATKNKEGKKRQQGKQEVPADTRPGGKETKAAAARQPGSKSMLNMLLLLTAILPFMFSWELMDANLTVRYGLLAAFVLVFLLYFYGLRDKLVTGGWPLWTRLAFIFGVAFGIWNLVSLFTATNVQQSYYGISRHLLNMLLLFIITQVAANEEGYLLRLCKLLSVAAILHSLVGVFQFYDIAFNDLPGNYKPYGLMGNRNLFGTAQVMLLPFAIFTLYKAGKTWKYLAALAVTGIAVSAILSQTRSSWLAGLVSILVGLFLVALFSPVNRKKWLLGTAAALVTVAALAFLLISTDKEGELSRSLKERTARIFSTDTSGGNAAAADNVAERLKIWSKTKELIQDKWLTGVGSGNWKVDISKYGSEGLAWAKGKYVPDSPHNDYLLVTAETGVPGLLLYLGIWGMIALMAFKTIRTAQTEDRRILNIVMLGGLAGYAVDSLFSFPMERIEHSLYAFLMGGIIVGTYILNSNPVQQSWRLKKWQLALFSLIAAFNLFLSFKKYQFEKYLVLSKLYENQGSTQGNGNAFQLSIDEGNKAKNAFVSISPNGFPVEAFIGLSYKGLRKYPEAMKEMDQSLRYHPYNKALLVNKGTVYSVLNKFDSAIYFYEKALKLTPEFDVIYFNLAMNRFMIKDYKGCLDALNKTDIGTNKDLLNIKQQSEAILAAQAQSAEKPVN